MRLSLYEIETVMRKASVGAGLPIGIAEDIGKAVCWLVSHDLPGIKEALNSVEGGMPQTIATNIENGVAILPNAQVSVCGPSAIDLLIGEDAVDKIKLLDADSAILLVGFAAIASGHHKLAFEFEFPNTAIISVSESGVENKSPLPDNWGEIIVTCKTPGNDSSKIPTLQNGVEVDETVWRKAEVLAAKTYVPESNKSRTSGAGAGVTDND